MYVVTQLMWGVFNFSICLPAHIGTDLPILLNSYTYPGFQVTVPVTTVAVQALLSSHPQKRKLFEFLGISLCVTFNISFPFQILPLLRDKIWNGKPGFEASRCVHETNRR